MDIVDIKPIRFLGDALKRLRSFPKDARHDVGHQLYTVQQGNHPDDFKSMSTVGKGVEELRVWDATGTFRVIYTARLADAVYVLHVFQKKTQDTSQSDITIAKRRYAQLMRTRL